MISDQFKECETCLRLPYFLSVAQFGSHYNYTVPTFRLLLSAVDSKIALSATIYNSEALVVIRVYFYVIRKQIS
jgi:hypothetical protein